MAGDTEPLGQGYAVSSLTLSSTDRRDDRADMDGVGNASRIVRDRPALPSPQGEGREFSRANELLAVGGPRAQDLLYQPQGHRAEDSEHVYYYTADGRLREVWRKVQGPPVVANAAADTSTFSTASLPPPPPSLQLVCSYYGGGKKNEMRFRGVWFQ